MKWHAVFRENGKFQDCEFLAGDTFEDAEHEFNVLHPHADYYELGRPLVEIEHDALTNAQRTEPPL